MDFLCLLLVLLHCLASTQACGKTHSHVFNVEEVPRTRLCRTKSIMTVNGQFPGPNLHAHRGDTIVVKVHNHASKNVTIHWHGVKQPRNPWLDGPEFITQCPIKPGASFTYTIILSTEEGTVWWHAHNDFDRATVHGAIVVRPRRGTRYPFPHPFQEFVIMLGREWWNRGANVILEEALSTGGEVNSSDAFTINGRPGDLYPCSSAGTFRMPVEHGKTYLLRVVNAAMSNGLFFSVASHTVVVVGSDGNYVKPLSSDYIMITPGETMDLLLEANQPPDALYYMAGRAFSYLSLGSFPTTATTAIVEYVSDLPLESTKPLLPTLPYYNDTAAATNFSFALRSPANAAHPVDVPKTVDQDMFIAVAINELECPQASCAGPNGTRLRASLNNISFVDPPIDILEAYYAGIGGVFGENFPSMPPYYYNFTATDQPLSLLLPTLGTEVRVLEYGARMEVVFQGTSLVMGDNHPMHLHGYSFYVVGWGYGNFDKKRDPLRYNLQDPPFKNTIGVPINGWVAVRFTANNPGVWFMHCHIERHMIWGMNTVLIVKDGEGPKEKVLPPPRYMPPC
ncbi:unnamed protein product [Musa acuminata subsp. malaccensis]|uniref:Laccase n=1 Tax=Musa acuminata subsp. malaccensis TaxID=214687 RepID=A0A8D7FEL5_MUSAM|nr:unnamed protein product [Musa acuminata subsp. malaccensis]